MSLAAARRIADAVLYEGYLLYPYRASAQKNQLRWQFGTFVPRGYAAAGGEPWAMQSECPLTVASETTVRITLRFLQLQHRQVEAADGDGAFRPVARLVCGEDEWLSWDEGVERQLELGPWPLTELLAGEVEVPLAIAAGRDEEAIARGGAGRCAGRLVRRRWPIAVTVRVSAAGASRAARLRVRVENHSPWPPVDDEPEDGEPATGELSPRELALRHSLLGAHLLLAADGGGFLSLLDPPEWAAEEARACVNEHALPVLVGAPGERGVMLASPILLYDYPAVAPESPLDLCDGTEIDEILTLRVMTMTAAEKREARATDERARRIVDHADTAPPEVLERLHGAMRPLGGEGWESFLNPPGEAPPEEASCEAGGVAIARGSRVRLRPLRGADAMDFFLAGREARVEGVYRDLEDRVHVAVTVADDPAGALHADLGRFFYFQPDELEPLSAQS